MMRWITTAAAPMASPMGTISYLPPALYRYLASAHEVALVLYDCSVAPLHEALPLPSTSRARLALTMVIMTT